MREMPDVVGKISEEVYNLAGNMVQAAMGKTVEEIGKPDHASAAAVGCAAAYGALAPLAMLFSKRPTLTEEEIKEKGQQIAWSLVTEETVIFAALVASRTATDHTPETCQFGFGPGVLWAALEDWQKIFPDKKPDDFFDPNLLKAARETGAEIKSPFDKLLASRINGETPRTIN